MHVVYGDNAALIYGSVYYTGRLWVWAEAFVVGSLFFRVLGVTCLFNIILHIYVCIRNVTYVQ